jgi:hypothetical protein
MAKPKLDRMPMSCREKRGYKLNFWKVRSFGFGCGGVGTVSGWHGVNHTA